MHNLYNYNSVEQYVLFKILRFLGKDFSIKYILLIFIIKYIVGTEYMQFILNKRS